MYISLPRLFKSMCLVLVIGLTACGGGGSSEEDTIDERTIAVESANTSEFVGVASYRKLSSDWDYNPFQYTIDVQLDAFDTDHKIPAAILGLANNKIGLNLPGNPDIKFGDLQYTLENVSCLDSSAQYSYDSIMLFDRSGSMATNDPTDQSRESGKVFVNNLGPSDRALVGQFSGVNQLIDFLTPMTSNISILMPGLENLKPFAGGTPLWDAMYTSIQAMPVTSSRKALLAFSDGEDTESSNANAQSVEGLAQNTDVSVYAINLRNSNSKELDKIALRTGGNVFSTDKVDDLVKYYGVLGQILSGRSTRCTLNIKVNFNVDSGFSHGSAEYAFGFGPSYTVSPEFVFHSVAETKEGTVTAELPLPLYPGRQVGSTDFGVPVFETDLLKSQFNTTESCVIASRKSIKNNCSNRQIYIRACHAEAGCKQGRLRPGQALGAPDADVFDPESGDGNYTWASCPFEFGYGFNYYVPATATGTPPHTTFQLAGYQDVYQCVFYGRFFKKGLFGW